MRIVGLRLASGARAPLLALLTVVWALGFACGRPYPVGRPCDLGAAAVGGASGQIVIISSGAVECPSGLCLGPTGSNAQGTGALCTERCASDEDCENNEAGPKGDPNDSRCEGGFACMWPTTVGPYQCQRFCVCRDLFAEPVIQKPGVCL